MLTQDQRQLVEMIERLPAEKVLQVLEFTRNLQSGPPFEYSDEWTQEDLRAFSDDTFRRVQENDPEE